MKTLSKLVHCALGAVLIAGIAASCRTPATSETQSREDKWESGPKTLSFERNAGNQNAPLTGRIDTQIRHIQIHTYLVPVNKQVPITVCDQNFIEPDGSDGQWYGFFDYGSRNYRSPEALAKAIKGVGPATAEALVFEGDFMRSRPTSWRGFVSEVRKMMKRWEVEPDMGRLAANLSSVITTYGEENRTTLGYYSRQVSQCHTEYDTVLAFEDRSEEKVLETLPKSSTVTIQFANREAVLLAGEIEDFVVSYDGMKSPELRLPDRFNQYTVIRKEGSDSNVTFVVQGSRRVVTPPNVVDAYLTSAGGAVMLNARDAFFSQLGEHAGKVIVAGTLYYDRASWFSSPKISDFRVELTGPSVSAPIPLGGKQIKPGSGIYATYRLQRLGTNVYSQEFSEEKRTASVSY